MKYFSLLFSLLIISNAQAGQVYFSDQMLLDNELKPFKSDGCSRFPDGLPLVAPELWLSCCKAHDVKYWLGGTAAERKDTDRKLGECVGIKTLSPEFGAIMYLGVRLGGNANLMTPWRWGYGWAKKRGYAPLSVAELTEAEKMYGADLVDLKSTIENYPVQSSKQTPAIMPQHREDKCLNKALAVLSQNFAEDIIVTHYSYSQIDSYKIRIRINNYVGDIIFNFNSGTTHNSCLDLNPPSDLNIIIN